MADPSFFMPPSVDELWGDAAALDAELMTLAPTGASTCGRWVATRRSVLMRPPVSVWTASMSRPWTGHGLMFARRPGFALSFGHGIMFTRRPGPTKTRGTGSFRGSYGSMSSCALSFRQWLGFSRHSAGVPWRVLFGASPQDGFIGDLLEAASAGDPGASFAS